MRFNRRIAAMPVAAALLLAFGVAAGAADKEPSSDKDYLQHSIYSDTAEIKAAELALKSSSSADVKAFAKKMVAAHTKHRKETMALAKSMGVDATPAVTKHAEETLAKLSKLTGKEFDAAYAKAQVMAHSRVLKMNEKFAKDGASKEVRDAAAKTAKVVHMHLEMAKKLEKGS